MNKNEKIVCVVIEYKNERYKYKINIYLYDYFNKSLITADY